MKNYADDDRAEHAVRQALLLTRETLGEGATLIDAAIEMHRRTSAGFETKWRSTRNPIWVWRCLARLNSLCIRASRMCPELRGRDLIEAPPSWCFDYFIEGAYRIEQLAAKRDFRGEMIPRFHFADGPLSADQCADLVPGALGFTKQGYSAFREYAAEDELRLMLEMQELEEARGGPSGVTLDYIMDAMGWQDERNARRKIARIRRERAEPRD